MLSKSAFSMENRTALAFPVINLFTSFEQLQAAFPVKASERIGPILVLYECGHVHGHGHCEGLDNANARSKFTV